jgi:cellulose synthase operon protein C
MKINLLFRPPENRTEDHRLKLWSAYHSRESDSAVVDLYVFRLIPYLFLGTFIAYFTLALALFVWISRKPQKDVGFWDVVVMPFDWKGFQEKRGRIYLEAGHQDVEDQKYTEGIMKIRIGLSKYPEDRDARLFLSQVYYSAGMIDRALDLLQKGVELGMQDSSYLNAFFRICYESEAFNEAVYVADLVLNDPESSKNKELVFFVQRFKVTSLIELGKIEEAYQIAHTINSDPEGIRRMIDAEYLSLIKGEKPIEALTLLEKWRFQIGSDSVQLESLFVDTYIELKDDRNLKRAITELTNIDRLDPELYVLAMKKWHRAGKKDELEEAFTRYMLLFGWDEVNLRKVNNLVTSIREIPLIEQVLNYTLKRGMNEEVILFNLFYAYLMDGRWDEASGVLDLLKGSADSFTPIDQRLIAIGELIVLLKQEQNNNLRILLLQELRRLRASISFYLTVGDILLESELFDVAVDTLEQGLAIFPHSRRIEEKYKETTQIALQYIRDNQEEEIIETLEFGPNEYLEQLDALLADKKYDETTDLITEIYRIGAPWLSARMEDFEYRKLQLYFETRDLQLQTQSTSLFLSNNPDKGPDLLELAQEYLDEGKTEQSLMLAQQVSRLNPSNQEARNLLRELGDDSSGSPSTDSDTTREEDSSLVNKSIVFEALEANIASKDWEATEAMIQKVLRASPTWLIRDRQNFDLIHIRYYLESGNFPSASSLIRIFMGSDVQSARELANLAKDYDGQGMEKERDFLMEQVQRKFPNMKL